jgi:hypothetical protein
MNNGTESSGLATADVKASDATVALNAGAEIYRLGKIYEGLATHGYFLTDAEKSTFEKIVREEYERQNKLQLVGLDNPGANIPALFQILLAFIQNIFSGKGGAFGDLGNIGNSFSNASTGAKNITLQNNINDMTTRVYDRMVAAGGNLKEAADLVTGWSQGENYARDMGKNQNGESLLLTAQLNTIVPEGTPQSLAENKTRLGGTQVTAASGNGLPDSTRNGSQPLTPSALLR